MVEINRIPDDELEHLVTPFFRHLALENVPQSEIAGQAIMETHEVVELRFSGDKNYSPVFPVTAMYRMNGHQVVTYAERFAEQYRQFQAGVEQQASGTPLERLAEYGISAAQISLCRAAKVYSIEALYHLEGSSLRTLGQSANPLKEMARAYMADRSRGSETAQELERLREEVAALRAGAIPPKDPSPEEMDAARQVADDEFASLSDAELKDQIEQLAGVRPRGNPNRSTLIEALKELKAA